MGQSGPLTSTLAYQKLPNHGSWNVLEGKRLFCWYRCGISLVLFMAIGTFVFLCNTDLLLLSTQIQVWQERVVSKSTPPPVSSWTTRVNTEAHSEAHSGVRTKAHIEVHTEVHTKIQWETPGPYYVAYPCNYIFVLDEPDACSVENPFLLLIVPVAAKNRVARDTIRRTWGNESLVLGKTVRLFFLLGLPGGKGSERLQADMEKERAEYQDLLQSDFLDSYHNLTIKTMMMLEWVASRCPNASYAMKIDSDMFLNVRNLVKMLLNPKTPKRNYITGLLVRNGLVHRNNNSKWYLPVDVYPDPTYPLYPMGMGYVFSTDLPKKLVDVSKQIKPLYIEDAHLGICLKKLGVKPTDPPSHSLFKIYMPVPYDRCHYASVITTTLDGPARLLQFWEDLHKPNPPCYKNKNKTLVSPRPTTNTPVKQQKPAPVI